MMRFYVLWAVILCIFSACKSKKVITAKEAPAVAAVAKRTKASYVQNVISSKNNAAYLYYTADVNYKDENTNQTLTIELQAKKDEYIWLNVKVLFVNVARIMIKQDSIRMLDFINRKYISASYNYMKNYTTVPLNFYQLQNLVYGNAMFDPTEDNLTIDTATDNLILFIALNKAMQHALYNKQNFKVGSFKLSQTDKAKEFSVNYNNFLPMEHNLWPLKTEIHIQAEKTIDCKFNLNNLATQKNKDPQFAVPRSYKIQVYL